MGCLRHHHGEYLRWPEKRADVEGFLQDWCAKFALAKSIVLVGGGVVSTKFAGEIFDFYPSTEGRSWHRGEGLRLVLGDSAVLEKDVMDGANAVTPGGIIITVKGVLLPAELVIATLEVRGIYTSFLSSSSSPRTPSINNALHTDVHILVKPTFQLTTNPNVFAAGDAVAIPEQHSLSKAHAHEPIVVSNILLVLQAKENGSSINSKGTMKEYGGETEGLVITNGRYRGTLYLD